MANILYYEDIQLVDGVKGFFGTGEDMEIYHNGSSSVINNNTGDFIIKTSVDNGDIYFQADNGSGGIATYFYLDGSLVNGSSVLGATRFPDKSKIYIGSGGDLEIFHNGSQTYIENYTGEFNFTQHANDGDMIFKCDDGSGGVTAYLTLDGGLGYTTVQKDIRFEDNVQLELGDGRDLVIYSDGTNGLISNQNGTLYITQANDDEDIILSSDNGSGGTTAYLTLDGSLTQMWADKKLQFSDNISATFGAGNDLQLYHNGSHSLISNQTGNLYIRNQTNDGDIFFQADDGSGGDATYMTIDGGAERNIFSKSLRLLDNVQLDIGSSDDFRIVHTSANNATFVQNYTGDLQIQNNSDGDDILFRCDDGSGGLTTYFYLNGGDTNINFQKDTLHPDNVKAKFGTSADLQIYHDGSNSYITEGGTGDLIISGDNDVMIKDGSGNLLFNGNASNSAELYFGGSKKFETTTNGIEVTGKTDTDSLLIGSGATVTTILDEDNMASNSATSLATQQSIKAYVDSSTTGVLTYQGVWNADTNSPTLSSGSGTPGYYYIVSVAGSTNLDGITDWAVGDWAVFSDQATDAWQKIDNTAVGNVSGTGTANKITKWTGSGTIANSSISDDGSTVTFSGDVVFDSTHDVMWDSSENRLEFWDNAYLSFGDPGGTPDLLIYHDGSNSYIKEQGTGNLWIQGSTQVNIGGANGEIGVQYVENVGVGLRHDNVQKLGTSSTGVSITGNADVSSNVLVGNADSYFGENVLRFKSAGAAYIDHNTTSQSIIFRTSNSSSLDTTALTITSAGNATFANKVQFGSSDDYIKVISGDLYIVAGSGKKNILYSDNTETLRLDESQNATFAGRVDVAGGDVNIQAGALSITSDGSNKATFTETGAGLLTIATQDDLILDSGSDITLDAGGNDIRLFNGGVEYGKFKNDSSDLALYSSIQDKDIIFKGNDGGSTIDALTLDMSAAGAAIFNDVIYVPSYMVHTGDTDTKIGFNTADNVEIRVGGNLQISASSSRAYLRYQGSNKIQTDSTGVNITGGLTTTASSDMAGLNMTSNIAMNDNNISGVGDFTVGGAMSVEAGGDTTIDGELKAEGGLAVTGNTTASGNIVLNGDSNIVLDTSVSSTQSSGTIIKIGSHMSALVAGNIYYAGNSMGNLYWYGADADSSSTENMLALSVGTDADVDGMLLNGIYHKASHGLTIGEPIYLSTTSMAMTNTAPSGANDYVRVLGYALDSNHIYFCPDNTWVKISS
jgi:hypothetical protein